MIILDKDIFKKAMNKVKAEDDLKLQTYHKIIHQQNHQHTQHRFPQMICIMAVCVLFLIGYSYFHIEKSIDQTKYSYITIDVNPSIELILNKDDLVISSKAYNSEGQDILDRISYQDQSYQDVLSEIFNDDEYQNYLENNSDIQVSVFSKNENKCNDLEKNIDTFINEHISSNHHYESVCIDEKTHHQAGSCHMSSGRYVLIQSIIDCSSYTMADLENKSLSELRQIYTDVTAKQTDTHHDETNEHHEETHYNETNEHHEETHQQENIFTNTHHQSSHSHH